MVDKTATPQQLAIPAPDVVMVPLKDLKPWKKNPRVKHAVDVIAKSITEFGFLSPIIIQKGTNRVLAGHGRLMALKQVGAEKAPCIIADIDDAKADLYTVTDNKAGLVSDWDFQTLSGILRDLSSGIDLSAFGWTDNELEPLLSATWKPDGEAGDLADFQRKKQGTPIQVTKPQRKDIEAAVARAKEADHKLADATEGSVLARICRAYKP